MGNLRQAPSTQKETEQGSNKRMSFVSSAMCGWRLTMEDAHITNLNFTNTCSLFAVFDGHGGAQVSTFAKKFFESQLLKNTNFIKKKYQQALIQTFEAIDKLLVSKQGEKEIKKIKKQIAQKQNNEIDQGPINSGCTAVVCLVTQSEIYCANAGDSRCVIYRKNNVQNMSEDHKPDNSKELKRITKAGGTVSDGRVCGCLNLSRALGDFQFKANKALKCDQQMVICKPDIIKKPLDGTQYIILGCDGIFEQKTNKQIMNIVRKNPNQDIKKTAQSLLDQLLSKNAETQYGLDNMSLIIVKMKK